MLYLERRRHKYLCVQDIAQWSHFSPQMVAQGTGGGRSMEEGVNEGPASSHLPYFQLFSPNPGTP